MGSDPLAPKTLDQSVSGHGGNPPGQGPFITLRLRVRERMIEDATYETYPCPGCHACGKAICDLVAKKRVEAAEAIRHDHLVERVGPLPSYRRHCYGLALLALADALGHLAQFQQEERSWSH